MSISACSTQYNDQDIVYKSCSCGCTKPLSDFYKGAGICKECWLLNDKYNPVRKANIQRYRKVWASKNRAHIRFLSQERRALKKQAFTNKGDASEIEQIFLAASSMVDSKGRVYEVEHLIPLIGRKIRGSQCSQICGLHTPLNLSIATKLANSSKSNKLLPEHAIDPSKLPKNKAIKVYVANLDGIKVDVITFFNGLVVDTCSI